MKSVEGLVFSFLLNALWQLPVLVLAGAAVQRLLRRSPAALQHRLWVLVAALALALPLSSTLSATRQAGAPVRTVTPAPPPQAGDLCPPDLSTVGPSDSDLLPLGRWPRAVTLGAVTTYGASLLFLAGRLLLSWHALRALARRSKGLVPSPADGELFEILERCRLAFGFGGGGEGKAPELRTSSEIASPVTYGLTFGAKSPVILLPEGFLECSSRCERLAAFGHEMAHIARHDFALHVLLEILFLPIGFHPAAWLLRRRIAAAREMACDEETIHRLLSPRDYARSLLSMAVSAAAFARPSIPLGILGTIGALGAQGARNAGNLEVRMKRMFEVRPRIGARRARIHLSLATLALAAVALTASGFAVRAVAGESTPPPNWNHFAGTWKGEPASDPKDAIPPTELSIEIVDGAPHVVLTFYRIQLQKGGAPKVDPIRQSTSKVEVQGENLTFRIHRDDFALPGEKPGPVDTDWKLELKDQQSGTLRSVWNSRFTPARERGENVPPPPPPEVMKRDC